METQSTRTGVGKRRDDDDVREAEVDKDGNIFTSSPITPITEFVIRNCICTLPGAFTFTFFTSLHLRSILIVGLVLLVFPLVLNLTHGWIPLPLPVTEWTISRCCCCRWRWRRRQDRRVEHFNFSQCRQSSRGQTQKAKKDPLHCKELSRILWTAWSANPNLDE